MKPNQVRAIAICVFRQQDSILVFEGYDALKRETFYRPLGGTIEFGERSHQTVIREIHEEIDAEITNIRSIGTLENVFTFEGQFGHEIVLVYEAEFAENSLYQKSFVMGKEDNGAQFKALWKPLADFEHGTAPLYPDGLLELLRQA